MRTLLPAVVVVFALLAWAAWDTSEPQPARQLPGPAVEASEPSRVDRALVEPTRPDRLAQIDRSSTDVASEHLRSLLAEFRSSTPHSLTVRGTVDWTAPSPRPGEIRQERPRVELVSGEETLAATEVDAKGRFQFVESEHDIGREYHLVFRSPLGWRRTLAVPCDPTLDPLEPQHEDLRVNMDFRDGYPDRWQVYLARDERGVAISLPEEIQSWIRTTGHDEWTRVDPSRDRPPGPLLGMMYEWDEVRVERKQARSRIYVETDLPGLTKRRYFVRDSAFGPAHDAQLRVVLRDDEDLHVSWYGRVEAEDGIVELPRLAGLEPVEITCRWGESDPWYPIELRTREDDEIVIARPRQFLVELRDPNGEPLVARNFLFKSFYREAWPHDGSRRKTSAAFEVVEPGMHHLPRFPVGVEEVEVRVEGHWPLSFVAPPFDPVGPVDVTLWPREPRQLRVLLPNRAPVIGHRVLIRCTEENEDAGFCRNGFERWTETTDKTGRVAFDACSHELETRVAGYQEELLPGRWAPEEQEREWILRLADLTAIAGR